MKWFVSFISAVNLFIGIKCLLNALHILHDSKYSQTATVIFAAVFLGMAAGGFYGVFVKNDVKLALFISAVPWIIGIMVLIVQMTTSDYK